MSILGVCGISLICTIVLLQITRDPAGSVAATDAIPAAIAREVSGVRFIDGDTLAFADDTGSQETIRLLAIDTPERNEQWYAEAREALKRLVGNGPVQLEFEKPGRIERDKYGRTLAYLVVNGKNINIEMVRLGWSEYIDQYGDRRYAREFIAAEAEARAARRGIWSSR